ncbi:response regulator [Enhygromyxa salina]|uniref:Response regulator UvrY n=1 Tax=Enhygromyxa salina TaxID=215803 RepID=A0A2S9YSJ6_9BACT|nr:response regulator transcription factor [Enhygromyxa salina]PRQ08074.1 Response regulator UvrY [Enhygromyxa salina]
MIRVFVADDHAVVREGLALVLEATPGMVYAGAAGETRELLAKVRDGQWDVLVLDLSMPGGGGLEILRQIQGLRPDIRTVVYSMYPEEQYGARVLQMGAAAYLSKSRSTDELLAAISRAYQGLRYVTQPIAEQFLDPRSGDALAPSLSDRELQILELIADGVRTSDIAATLCISASTVSTHLKRIKGKFRVSSTTELVQAALRTGVVVRDPPAPD